MQPGVGLTRDTTYAEGIISIADGEGVFSESRDLFYAETRHVLTLLHTQSCILHK